MVNLLSEDFVSTFLSVRSLVVKQFFAFHNCYFVGSSFSRTLSLHLQGAPYGCSYSLHGPGHLFNLFAIVLGFYCIVLWLFRAFVRVVHLGLFSFVIIFSFPSFPVLNRKKKIIIIRGPIIFFLRKIYENNWFTRESKKMS